MRTLIHDSVDKSRVKTNEETDWIDQHLQRYRERLARRVSDRGSRLLALRMDGPVLGLEPNVACLASEQDGREAFVDEQEAGYV